MAIVIELDELIAFVRTEFEPVTEFVATVLDAVRAFVATVLDAVTAFVKRVLEPVMLAAVIPVPRTLILLPTVKAPPTFIDPSVENSP